MTLRFHDACRRAYKSKAFKPAKMLQAGKLCYSNQMRSQTSWIEVMFVDGEAQVYEIPLDWRPAPELRSDATPSRYCSKPTAIFRMCDPAFDEDLAGYVARRMGKPVAEDWMTKGS